MIQLTINNIATHAEEGETILEVATRLNIPIPTMCHVKGLEHHTSCQVCLVKEERRGKFYPSCSARAEAGMQIVTHDSDVIEARRTALELLLSEHIGDCEAPCRIACPAFMNIPEMNRLIQQNQMDAALEVVMNDIALPGVMGRICPAPCENACKRKPIDQAVSICLLKRAVADTANKKPIVRPTHAANRAKVAIVGAGPAGLAAAYYLQLKGIQAVIYDRNELPGGSLQYHIPNELLDKKVLEKEITAILEVGVIFKPLQTIDYSAFKTLQTHYNAVVLAMGTYDGTLESWGLQCTPKQVISDKKTYQTNLPQVFAIGNLHLTTRMAIRSAAQGKEVAIAIEQLLTHQPVTGEKRRFNSTIGRLYADEFLEYLKEASPAQRVTPKTPRNDFDSSSAIAEAERCMHCDCRDATHCELRKYADEYQSSRKRFIFSERKHLKKLFLNHQIVYEPGKCIKCGICVRISTKNKLDYGFTYLGRGFDVAIGIPFQQDLERLCPTLEKDIVEACPTGALANR